MTSRPPIATRRSKPPQRRSIRRIGAIVARNDPIVVVFCGQMADVATNRQARHRYQLIDHWEAGLVLTGTEVKSLRGGKAQIKDGYASIDGGEVWLHNVHIPHYPPATRDNHEPERPRKLLLHRREIDRLIGTTREKGLTLIPTRLYFKGPNAKVEIALARGRDVVDKRHAIREREMKRDMERAVGRRR